MKKYIGYYNEAEYVIQEVKKSYNVDVYNAGNSPFDSAQYVKMSDGVGIKLMKEYCEQTGKEIAAENNGEFLGAEYFSPEMA